MWILVVDDDRDIREMLAQTLEDEGYAVRTATDGRDAMRLLASADELPCTILLDLMMPVMNGWEFRAAQRRDPHLATIPVLMLSARSDIPFAETVMDGVEYIAKPIDFDHLMDAVVRHCGTSLV
jgi:CheY-like chemotaxis protein